MPGQYELVLPFRPRHPHTTTNHLSSLHANDNSNNNNTMSTNCSCQLEILDPEGNLVLEVGQHTEPTAATSTNPTIRHVRIQTSTEKLATASTVFDVMFNGRFAEATSPVLDDQGRQVLRLPEDDPVGMLEICKILHQTPGVENTSYEYDKLMTISIIYDKYDFGRGLATWFEEKLIYQSFENISTCRLSNNDGYKAVEAMMFAHLTGNLKLWARATSIAAYTLSEADLETALDKTFEEEMSREFFAQMVEHQTYLRTRFANIAAEALQDLTDQAMGNNDLLTDRDGMEASIDNGETEHVCVGLMMQLGYLTASLSNKRLLRHPTDGGSVQQHAKALLAKVEALELGLDGLVMGCSEGGCRQCRDPARLRVAALMLNRLFRVWENVLYGDRGLCLACATEAVHPKGSLCHVGGGWL